MVDVQVSVSSDDQARLDQLFDPSKVADVIQLVAKAGAAEAIAYATGRAVFSTMAELRMFRVFCLLDNGMSLTEAEELVAKLFKLSPSGARRVVSATLARYAFELDAKVNTAVQGSLEAATFDEKISKRWEVRLPAGFVRDRALELCRASDQPNPTPDRGAVWHFPHETFNWLRAKVNLAAKAKPS